MPGDSGQKCIHDHIRRPPRQAHRADFDPGSFAGAVAPVSPHHRRHLAANRRPDHGLAGRGSRQAGGQVLGEFANRHEQVEDIFRKRFTQVKIYLEPGAQPSPERQMLIGAYFTHEYSPESTALFNPSIVPHPDQSGLPERRAAFHLEPAGHGRRAHFLHHLPHRHRQRATSHHAHAAGAVCDRAGTRAQRRIRQGIVCPQT